MHGPDEYRRAATETRRLARQAPDKWERESLLRIAAEWERLAQQQRAKIEADQDGGNSN
jgi:hypothetical protein